MNLKGRRITKPQVARRSRSAKRVLYALFLTLEEFQFLNTRLSLVSTTLYMRSDLQSEEVFYMKSDLQTNKIFSMKPDLYSKKIFYMKSEGIN